MMPASTMTERGSRRDGKAPMGADYVGFANPDCATPVSLRC
jgi:hypothetical protein